MKTDHLDSPDEAPLYAQVYDSLRDRIQSGQLAPGAVLPTEKALEKHYGVSRITVRRALDDLERQGLIERGRGRPARVAVPLVAATHIRVDEELSSILEIGRGTEAQVLAYAWRMPDAEVAERLQVAADEPVLEVERLRSRGGRPVLHTLARVPAPVGALLNRAALQDTTMLDQLAARGVQAARAEMEMYARACNAHIASLLGLNAGEPVFVMERLVSDTTGRPIQSLTATFRADSFCYRIASMQSADQQRSVEIEAAGHFGFETAP